MYVESLMSTIIIDKAIKESKKMRKINLEIGNYREYK